jgi:hypothetical protein
VRRRTSPSVPRSAKVRNNSRDGRDKPHTDTILTDIFFTGELVFGVARIFASFNDTFVHVTDLSYV